MLSNSLLPFATENENGGQYIELKCLLVRQPIGSFFIASIPYNQLMTITYADTRRVVDENDKEGFEKILGIQREVKPSRLKELHTFVNTKDACFPTSIILSIPEECATYDPELGLLKLSKTENYPMDKIAKILDGQHRIRGLEAYSGHEIFELNISIFIDLDPEYEAYIFSTINQAQTKVNKSLVYDLYSLAVTRSPQKLAHNIAVTLNDNPDSPFYRKIKRLGTASPKNLPSAITQAAFVDSLLKLISKDTNQAIKDRDAYLRGKLPDALKEDKLVFRKFMLEKRDYELTDVLWDYFEAIRDRWPYAWASSEKGDILNKTNGFMALMRFLRDIHISKNRIGEPLTKTEYAEILDQIDIEEHHFTVDQYPPGSSGESKLYRDLIQYLPVNEI